MQRTKLNIRCWCLLDQCLTGLTVEPRVVLHVLDQRSHCPRCRGQKGHDTYRAASVQCRPIRPRLRWCKEPHSPRSPRRERVFSPALRPRCREHFTRAPSSLHAQRNTHRAPRGRYANAPAVPAAPKMHAAPCLEPRSVGAPTLLAEHKLSGALSKSPPLACIGAEQRQPHPLIQRPPLLCGTVFATPCTPRFTLHAHHAPVLLRPGEVLRGFVCFSAASNGYQLLKGLFYRS